MKRETFEELYKVNVNEKTESKNGLTYLSWAWAWAEFVKICPDASYEIKMFDGKPYIYDEKLGYMVFTSITADGDTKEMWLPVMDGNNKAMKDHAYKYMVKNYEKVCEAASMFDINKTIMRCLTKNISMFGLGLYIYAGEDLPEAEVKELKCVDCGEAIVDAKKKDGSQWKSCDIAQYNTKTFGRCLCPACQRKAYDAAKVNSNE